MSRRAQPVSRAARRIAREADPARRRRLIAAVHAAAKKAGLDEETRRDLMERVTGKRSAAEMTLSELGRVLDAIHGRAATRPWQRLIAALWQDLAWLGEVQNPSQAALDAFVRRQTGRGGLRMLDARSADRVIEALKAWLHRAGVVAGAHMCIEEAVAHALWDHLYARGRVAVADHAACHRYACRVLGLPAVRPLLPHEWRRVLPELGRWLRRVEGEKESSG